MDELSNLQNEALKTAAEHIKSQRKKSEIDRLKIICLTAFASVVVVCAAVVACFAIYSQQKTIIEQQYALNMQYSSLTDLLSGAEITETTTNEADSGVYESVLRKIKEL